MSHSLARITEVLAFGFAVAIVLTAVAPAADQNLQWPRFRGPDGSGVAENQRPPVEIGPEKNVKWKVPTPAGFSSPIVVGDMLVITAFDNGKLYTLAYDRADGRELWRSEAPAKQIENYHKTEGSPASSTSVTDGKQIVSYFGSCGLFCYDTKGKELWRYELPTVSTMGDFGTGVSPILADGLVVLLRDETKDPKIIAVDIQSGLLKWETKRQSRSGFGTPIVIETQEGKQIVAPGYGQLIAYDLKSGEQKWFVAGMPAACCTSPVAANDRVLFAGWSPGDASNEDPNYKMPKYDDLLKMMDTNGDGVISKDEAANTPFKDFFSGLDLNKDGFYTREEAEIAEKFMSASKNSAFAVTAGGSGDVTASHVLWKKTKGLPYVPSAIVCQGQYIMVKDGGLLSAYDVQNGNELYVLKRAIASGTYYASPVVAGGHIYFTSLADGTITVLKAGAASPEVIAENPPLGERTAATPAIADDTLYVRTAGNLYAFSTKK
jgi:outer membrane protein assembly factor BamB